MFSLQSVILYSDWLVCRLNWVLAAVTLREFGLKFLTVLVSGCLWQTCFSVRSWERQIRLMTKDFTTSFLTIQANFQL